MTTAVHHHHVDKEDDWKPSLVLPPLAMKTLHLGEYEDPRLIPRLTFEYEPAASADVTTKETRQTMPDGAVRVLIHFQNFTTQPVIVVVHEEHHAPSQSGGTVKAG